jgi:hypothetical protein
MRLLQSQKNILIFNWCLILQVSIFVIISLNKNSLKKVVKLGGIHDPGCGSGEFSREA